MELLSEIGKIVTEAGKIILSARNIESVTQTKSSFADLVTAYDVRVENFLRENLLALLPEANFFGEEEKENTDPGKGWVFIVDPIDGTSNFVRDLAQSAVSVALAKDGQVEYAVALNPYRNELFTAARGKGAYLNGERIRVSTCPLEKGIFGFGTAPYNKPLHPATMNLASQMLERSCDFRRMGAAVLDLCALAAGRLDAFFEYELSPWDYAAGSLLVTEAGGKISTLDGKDLPIIRKSSVWAANEINFSILKELDV